jgi:hypothetical protein
MVLSPSTVPINAFGKKQIIILLAESLIILFRFDAEMSKWLFTNILSGNER